jgi:hypothetical protein
VKSVNQKKHCRAPLDQYSLSTTKECGKKIANPFFVTRGFFRSGYVPFAPFEKSEEEVLTKVYTNLFWAHKTAKTVAFIATFQAARRQKYGDNSIDTTM